ncbi:unnamed protein product [Protopolystoma xenopodis]|uniref:Cadherin domain-containing protein n=1 Tax=Protopolystoma xenopodis TaxID=117903 RepID=A0A448XFF2_9PLAT|nr:unnamed protein product [Protopolystoma xenopodis]
MRAIGFISYESWKFDCQVAATDLDDPVAARTQLTFTFAPNTFFRNPTQFLTIAPTTGVITTSKVLLRTSNDLDDVLPSQLYFTVRVDDWGEPSNLKVYTNS